MQFNFQSIGRVLYALPMAVFGIDHFMKAQSMKAMVPGFVPGDVIWVYLTGIALVATAISIILKKQVWWSTMILAAMLLGFILTIHLPGMLNGQMPMAMINLLKDAGLMGGALYLGGQFSGKKQTQLKTLKNNEDYDRYSA
jgi:putative oxidoreductase